MRILAVDDEQLQLDKLAESIMQVVPDAELHTTRRPAEALMLAEDHEFDVAFLDIQMKGMTGIELVTLLKRVAPTLNIIFVTAYNEYKAEAMDLRVSGYITKPVTPEKIRQELLILRYPVKEHEEHINNIKKQKESKQEPLIYVQCFGNFDVFDKNKKPIHFSRSKAKEILAYLICKRGSRCSSREIASIIYDGKDYDTRVQDLFRHVTAALTKALREVGAEKILVKEHQDYAVDTSLIECDFYKYIEDPSSFSNSYTGEFMAQYSWAEDINGYLEFRL